MQKAKGQNHVLIFAPYFPPRLRVGAIRPYRLSKYLSRLGWKVTVICIKDSNHELTEQQSKDLSDVEIVELSPPFDRTQKNITRGGSSERQKSFDLESWLDRQFPLDTWLPFFWMKKSEISALIKEIQPDILWSTSDPWSGGFVAGKIANENGIPWVTDFRDPWTLCTVRFPRNGKLARFVDRKVESWMIKNADFITFTSEQTKRTYNQAYPGMRNKSAVIYNSFDLEINPLVSPSESEELSEDSFNILFLGSFRDLSTAELILEVLDQLRTQDPDVFDRIKIHSYGDLKGEDLETAQRLSLTEKFVRRQKVTYNKVQDEIKNFDLLLLTTHPERDEIVPAKLFDYMISGKPVFSLVPNSEVEQILNDTQTGMQFSAERIRDAVTHLVNVYNGNLPDFDPDEEVIRAYDASNRAAQLSTILSKVIEKHGG